MEDSDSETHASVKSVRTLPLNQVVIKRISAISHKLCYHSSWVIKKRNKQMWLLWNKKLTRYKCSVEYMNKYTIEQFL
jgi:hypothetical protein